MTSLTTILVRITLAIVAAVAFAFVATILSLGILAPFGLLTVALVMFLSGLWLLLNRKERIAFAISVCLICAPIVPVVLFGLHSVIGGILG